MVRFLLALVAATLLAACGPSYPKMARLDAGATVLAFGDSLTFGTGTGAAQAYPTVLEALIGRKVVRAGVPGETSAEGLARLPGVLDEVEPKLLVLCHGGNDFLRKLGDAQAAENVKAMVRLAQERSIAVVIIATPKPGFGIAPPKFYGEIGMDLKVPVESTVLAEVLSDRDLKSDLVHPNGEGYRRMAEAVARLLKRAGAV